MRTAVAWLLIVLGLAGIVSGFGMFYIHSLLPKPPHGEAEPRARLGEKFLPWSAETIGFYGGGCSGLLIGTILTLVGMRLRHGDRKDDLEIRPRDAKGGEKQTCPECGGRSPSAARNCYRCGRALR